MRKLVLGALVALALARPDVVAAQLVPYDDFASGVLDPDKWYGFDVALVGGNRVTETVRQVRFGMLELRANLYGANNSDSGGATLVPGAGIQNPAAVTTLQAVATVLATEATNCPTNPGFSSRATAEVAGTYFNDGSSTGPSDLTGNVIAIVRLEADGGGTRSVRALVLRCANSGCTSSPSVASQTFATTWAPQRPMRLTLAWDQVLHQFVASVKPVFGGTTETQTLPYGLSDSTTAIGGGSRTVRLVTSAANCNGSHAHGFMRAVFDSVMVNP